MDYPTRPLSAVRYVVIHHSGRSWNSSACAIAEYHVNSLGWPGIGYHFVVRQTGEVLYVGDLRTTRYNVAGRNGEVIGICLPGDFTQDPPGDLQLARTCWLLGRLGYAFPGAELVGHRDIAFPVSPTECPGNSWPQWRGILERAWLGLGSD